MKKLKRREFLKLASIIASAAVIKVEPLTRVLMAEESPSNSVQYFNTTCRMCVNFCGIKVKTENGVLRAIYPMKDRAVPPYGGKSDYFNIGNCCKGIAGLWNIYNPYRVKKPLKRTNPEKGMDKDPQWVEIGWEEAFNEVANKIATIKSDNPKKIIWYHGHGKYLVNDNWMKAFTEAIGTPNMVHRTTTCEAAKHIADELTWGGHGPLPDIEYCNYLINLGGNYAEGDQWARWLDHATMDAKERGMKLVVVEPRLSNLAAISDEWVPIRPGKDVLFLLSMARVLIEENFIDREFLVTYTNAPYLIRSDGKVAKDGNGNPLVWDSNQNKPVPYDSATDIALEGSYNDSIYGNGEVKTAFQVFRDYLMSEKLAPEDVEEECGVPAEQIRRIAKEFGSSARIGATITIEGNVLRYRPVAVYTFRGVVAKEYGVQNWRAGLILMMLVGAIDAVGGFLTHDAGKSSMGPSSCTYPPARIDLKKSAFFPHASHDVGQQALFTALEPSRYGIDYTPEMQIFFATNRPFSTSNSELQFKALENTYNVVIDIAMSETAWFADIVFPDKTYLESYGYYGGRWVPHARHHTLNYPIVNPYNIPYQNLDIMFELAKRAGFMDDFVSKINSKFGFTDPVFTVNDATAEKAIDVLWRNKTKTTLGEGKVKGFGGEKLVDVRERYLMGIEDKFKGPGKPKIAFYCDSLVQTKENLLNLFRTNPDASQKLKDVWREWYEMKESEIETFLDTRFSPLPKKEHAEPVPHIKAKDYPFYLITFKRIYRTQSGYCNINPLLNHVAHDSDTNHVWINAQKAKELGINDGDKVVIESRLGETEGIAKLTEGIRPDTVAVSYHYGQWSGGYPEWSRKGTWINKVIEYHPDIISGMNSYYDTKVKVYKK